MTSKVKGTEGIEFPDATVQSSAAYSKAESDTNVAALFSNITLFGAGQGRALGVNYTNNSGRPMFVNVAVDVTSPASISAIVSGFTFLGNNAGAGGFVNVSFIVPAGGTYQVNTTSAVGSIFYWTEAK